MHMKTSVSLVRLLTHSAVVFSLLLTAAPPLVAATTRGPNLIVNPSFETAGSTGLPANWLKGGYGTNTRTPTYPATPSQDGAVAARVSITSYSSGDAKWYFPYLGV